MFNKWSYLKTSEAVEGGWPSSRHSYDSQLKQLTWMFYIRVVDNEEKKKSQDMGRVREREIWYCSYLGLQDAIYKEYTPWTSSYETQEGYSLEGWKSKY